MKKLALLAILLLNSTAYSAALHNRGILANSGEAADSLVRFAEQGSSGMGVALDRFGTLWDRAGEGRINRYSIDGRLIAHYTCPKGTDRNKDTLTVVGDTVVLCVRGWLHRLSVNAPSGASAEPLNMEALISHGSHKGRIACLDKNRQLSLLDPSSRESKTITTLTFNPNTWMDMDADGNIYVMDERWQIHKIVDGKDVRDGWPKGSPGEEPQVIDTDDGRFWFGHSWHGTIKRFDVDLRPAPGVVQGGASGHFIGHLPQNSELNNGRGVAHIKGRLYAISGMGCVMHLLEWNPDTRKMDIVRRLGAIARLPGLGIDSDGRILVINGNYEWADRPDSPHRFGTTGDVCGQVVTLPNDNIVAPGVQYGNQSRVMYGRLNTEVHIGGNDRIKLSDSIQKKGCGTAVYRQGDKLILLLVSREGVAQAGYIGGDGKLHESIGNVSLKTSKPVNKWTTLAMKDDRTLLAAADGQVIEFTPDGSNWKESRRWNEPAMSESGPFGSEVYITADDGRLWVADTTRHRVVCIDLANKRELASFGKVDSAGTSLDRLSSPTTIAARSRRAVVFDGANQRIVKLELE